MRRLALALFLAGCAENAVLELQVTLPPAPAPASEDDDPWYAQVQVRRSSAAFVEDGFWSGTDPRAIQLGESRQVDCISVVSHDDTVSLNVRVNFCRSPDCDSDDRARVPELRYSLEHPFYIGRHTYWHTTIDRVPECATDDDCTRGVCLSADRRCGCATTADCCPAGEPCRHECIAGGCVEQIGRCAIEGCVTGGDPSDFCNLAGQHLCETGGVDRVEAYMCSLSE
jgi:hypothetical protein